MSGELYSQVNSTLPINKAKSLLRTEDKAQFKVWWSEQSEAFSIEAEIVSNLDGSVLLVVSNEVSVDALVSDDAQITLTLGTIPSLTLTCEAKALTDANAKHAVGRFVGRHGTKPTNDTIVKLLPITVILQEDGKAEQIDCKSIVDSLNETAFGLERRAVDHMNDDHLDAIKLYAEVLLHQAEGDWHMAGLDMDGIDLIHGDRYARLWFNPPLKQPDQIKARLVELVQKARATQFAGSEKP